MREIHEERTGSNLANAILDVLNAYEISLKQIYTLTVDNGRNIVSAGTLLNSFAQVDENADSDDIASISVSSEEDDDQKDVEEDEDEIQNSVDDITYVEEYANEIDFSYDSITTIRCACHTLQFAGKDFFNNIITFLPQIRGVCKKLRKPRVLKLLKIRKLPKAILDCPARWNSTFKMCKRLLLLKDFCIKRSRLTHLQWQQIENIANVLQPVYETSINLQDVDITTSDFYFAWYL